MAAEDTDYEPGPTLVICKARDAHHTAADQDDDELFSIITESLPGGARIAVRHHRDTAAGLRIVSFESAYSTDDLPIGPAVCARVWVLEYRAGVAHDTAGTDTCVAAIRAICRRADAVVLLDCGSDDTAIRRYTEAGFVNCIGLQLSKSPHGTLQYLKTWLKSAAAGGPIFSPRRLRLAKLKATDAHESFSVVTSEPVAGLGVTPEGRERNGETTGAAAAVGAGSPGAPISPPAAERSTLTGRASAVVGGSTVSHERGRSTRASAPVPDKMKHLVLHLAVETEECVDYASDRTAQLKGMAKGNDTRKNEGCAPVWFRYQRVDGQSMVKGISGTSTSSAARVVVISTMWQDGSLVVADGGGERVLVSEDDIRRYLGPILGTGDPEDTDRLPSVVVLLMCKGEKFAQALKDLGVQHVIWFDDKLENPVAANFIERLVEELVSGSTVWVAFFQATAAVGFGFPGAGFKDAGTHFHLTVGPGPPRDMTVPFRRESDATSYKAFRASCQAFPGVWSMPCPEDIATQVPLDAEAHHVGLEAAASRIEEHLFHEARLIESCAISASPDAQPRKGRPRSESNDSTSVCTDLNMAPASIDIDSPSMSTGSVPGVSTGTLDRTARGASGRGGSSTSHPSGRRPSYGGGAASVRSDSVISIHGRGSVESGPPVAHRDVRGGRPSSVLTAMSGGMTASARAEAALTSPAHHVKRARMFAVMGLAGSGKTTAVQHFVRSCAYRYQAGVLWVDATSPESIIAGYRDNLYRLGCAGAYDIDGSALMAQLNSELESGGNDHKSGGGADSNSCAGGACSSPSAPATAAGARKGSGRRGSLDTTGLHFSSGGDDASAPQWLLVWDGANTLNDAFEDLLPSALNGHILLTSQASEAELHKFDVFLPMSVNEVYRLSEEQLATIILRRSGWRAKSIDADETSGLVGVGSSEPAGAGASESKGGESATQAEPAARAAVRGAAAASPALVVDEDWGAGAPPLLATSKPATLEELLDESPEEHTFLMRIAGTEVVDGMPCAAVWVGEVVERACCGGSSRAGGHWAGFSTFFQRYHDPCERATAELGDLFAPTAILAAITKLEPAARDLLEQMSFTKHGSPVPRAMFSRGALLRKQARLELPYDTELCVCDTSPDGDGSTRGRADGAGADAVDVWLTTPRRIDEAMGYDGPLSGDLDRIAEEWRGSPPHVVIDNIERRLDDLLAQLSGVCLVSHASPEASAAGSDRATNRLYESLVVPKPVLEVARQLAKASGHDDGSTPLQRALPAAQWRAFRSMARATKVTWSMSTQESIPRIQRLSESPVALMVPHAHASVKTLSKLRVKWRGDGGDSRVLGPGSMNCRAACLLLTAYGVRTGEFAVKVLGGEEETARDLATTSIELMERLLSDGADAEPMVHRYLAVAYARLARMYVEVGKLSLAEPMYEKHMSMIRHLHPSGTHRLVAEALNRMGFLHLRLSHYEKAAKYFEDALGVIEPLLKDGTHDTGETPEVAYEYVKARRRIRAMVLRNLGDARKELGQDRSNPVRLASAVDAYTESLKEYENVYAHGKHPNIAALISATAQLYFKLGQYPWAMATYINALEMYRGLYGLHCNNKVLAKAMGDLGHCYVSQGRLEDAEGLIAGSLEMLNRIRAHNTCNYGLALRLMGKYIKALAHRDGREGRTDSQRLGFIRATNYFQDALETELRIHGTDSCHKHVAALRTSLGRVLMHMGKYDESQEHLTTAHSMWKHLFRESKFERRSIAFTERDLAELYALWYHPHEAVVYATASLERFQQMTDPVPHLMLGKVHDVLGDAKAQLGSNAEALVAYDVAMLEYERAGDVRAVDSVEAKRKSLEA